MPLPPPPPGEMNNRGPDPLKVPGFSTVPLQAELAPSTCFAHASHIYTPHRKWSQKPRVTARELAMIELMDRLIDVRDWHSKVFDEGVVRRWRQDALLEPLISDAAWEWCLAELQDKAAAYGALGYVRVADVGSCVCKSDSLVPDELRREIAAGAAGLLDQSRSRKDRRFEQLGQVFNLVDPSLFPLVFGKTAVLVNGDSVDLRDFASSYGRGETAPTQEDVEFDEIEARVDDDTIDAHCERYGDPAGNAGVGIHHRWSLKAQWLPCDVDFASLSGTDVRIASYINNLHPVHYEKLYRSIEKLMSFAIEPLNGCLVDGGTVRVPMRIRTYGFETLQPPDWFSNRGVLYRQILADPTSKKHKQLLSDIKQWLKLHTDPDADPVEMDDDEFVQEWSDYATETYERINRATHPEPGTAYSYADWKAGKNGAAIVGKSDALRGKTNIPPDPDQAFYSIGIQDSFRSKGLQFIVKFSNIELDSDNPCFAGSDWYVEAQANEHIVAVAVYYYDVKNVTDGRIRYRQATDMDWAEFAFWETASYDRLRGVDVQHGLAEVFGFEHNGDERHVFSVPGTQEMGSASVLQGRLLTWPNTLQHRVEPFALKDQSMPGHRRSVVLYLVDPNYRICSTMNVPPQQHDWWAECALATENFESNKAAANVPPEVWRMIADCTGEWPMGMAEADRIKRLTDRDRNRAFTIVELKNNWFPLEDLY